MRGSGPAASRTTAGRACSGKGRRRGAETPSCRIATPRPLPRRSHAAGTPLQARRCFRFEAAHKLRPVCRHAGRGGGEPVCRQRRGRISCGKKNKPLQARPLPRRPYGDRRSDTLPCGLVQQLQLARCFRSAFALPTRRSCPAPAPLLNAAPTVDSLAHLTQLP